LENHRNAWRRIVQSGQDAIVVEADFVPVVGFGRLPLPCDKGSHRVGIGYLYACGPQLWDLAGGLRGHAGSTVAYFVPARSAEALLQFAEEATASRDPEKYSGWDSELGFWLNARGLECFLPYRHYGEHGGIPNPEHKRAGLRPVHRADLLAGRLAYLPSYAGGDRTKYLLARCSARVWGLVRLLAGRYLSLVDLRRSDRKGDLLRVAVGRQFLRRLPSAKDLRPPREA
jgi:hypothetical protein